MQAPAGALMPMLQSVDLFQGCTAAPEFNATLFATLYEVDCPYSNAEVRLVLVGSVTVFMQVLHLL